MSPLALSSAHIQSRGICRVSGVTPKWRQAPIRKIHNGSRLEPCRFQEKRVADQPDATVVKTDYNTAHEGVDYISCEDLHASLDSFAYILDVQSKENFVCTGHVPSASCKNIPINEFMSLTLKRVSELLKHKDDPVVVLSNRGRTAASVQMMLTNAFGFENVRALEGGMQAWREKGLPVEFGTDCAIINAHCPWIDNNELLCSLQQMQQKQGATDDDTELEHPMFK